MNSMKKQKDRTLKDILPGQYVPNMLLEIDGEITKKRMKRPKREPKQKQHPIVDVTGDKSKDQCCKE